MRSILIVAALAVLGAGMMNGVAGGGAVTYVASGTLVAKSVGVDDGVVVCDLAAGAGVGGACVPFGDFDSIHVQDAALGENVAFQVCIDNNGDGICGGQNQDRACLDDISFSHDDKGNFFNPLGPLPKGFPGCVTNPGFPGYVVFLCTGVHTVGGGGTPLPLPTGAPAHAHAATGGSITGTTGGTGFGDFCLPQAQGQVKQYFLV